MLRKNSLFELVKSLDIHEKRYIVSRSNKINEKGNAYTTLIGVLDSMELYSENNFKKACLEISKSKKTDVKKHYLYYWILKHLNDYHSKNYSNYIDIRNIQILVDRSLFSHAIALIPNVKAKLVESEKYLDLMMLLEIELKIQKYMGDNNAQNIFEELRFYSKKYADLKILESIKYKFRKILDYNVFSRSESDQANINNLFKNPIIKSRLDNEGFLLSFNYNLLFYWKNGTENNWQKAYKFALKNYNLLNNEQNIIKNFPDETLQIILGILTSSSLAKQTLYSKGLNKLKNIALLDHSKRLKDDCSFYMHISELIHFNNQRNIKSEDKFIKAAEKYIENNKHKFSIIRVNNFYFDLAKSYFYIRNYNKAFILLNEIYQNLNVKGTSVDFYTHSRLLFCLTCYEIDEKDLMISVAKSVAEFMKRNNIYYKFEKRIINFIVKELPFLEIRKNKASVDNFEKLKSDFDIIFRSEYELKVLNYFDYYSWIYQKIEFYNSKNS